MNAPRNSSSLLRQIRPRARTLVVVICAIATVLVVAAASTSMTWSTASGVFVGLLVGAGISALVGSRLARRTIATAEQTDARRQAEAPDADQAALDRLEPLGSDAPR